MAAGAAGTTALNAVTYLDMAGRGRGTSSAPQDTVEELADRADLSVPGDGDTRENRVSGLGALTGIAAGVGVGALFGAARGAGWRPGLAVGAVVAAVGALIGTNGPMTALRITDPRTWSGVDWVTDIVPHMAYGAVTAGVVAGGLDRW